MSIADELALLANTKRICGCRLVLSKDVPLVSMLEMQCHSLEPFLWRKRFLGIPLIHDTIPKGALTAQFQ